VIDIFYRGCLFNSNSIIVKVFEVRDLTLTRISSHGKGTSWEVPLPSDMGEYYQNGDHSVKIFDCSIIFNYNSII
jgi:hypothetical protein